MAKKRRHWRRREPMSAFTLCSQPADGMRLAEQPVSITCSICRLRYAIGMR